jgi:hypothetical protein
MNDEEMKKEQLFKETLRSIARDISDDELEVLWKSLQDLLRHREEKKPTKIVYIKYCDPMMWTKPNENFYEDALQDLTTQVIRTGGLLLKENDESIILGEVHLAEDNPHNTRAGIEYPVYRGISIISKTSIITRKEFDIE